MGSYDCVGSSRDGRADIIVIYRQGFPDTTAPAQILERKLGARMVSYDSSHLEKIQEEGNYNQVIAFDTFLEPEKLEKLKNELSKLDPSTKLIVYVKKGDTAYDKLHCDEKTEVDYKLGSHLLPALERAGMAITKGAQLLDKGLSHDPKVDERALRELYTTRESSSETLFAIVEANADELQKLLAIGHSFVEKLLSQTKLLVKTAQIATLKNGLRIGFQLAATGISVLGPALIDTGNVDIAIVLTATDPFRDNGHSRYSIRTSVQFSARKIYEFINNNTRVIRGGGDDIAAGMTTEASPAQIMAILSTAATDAIRR
jgi:hypothetical protein